MRRATKVVEAGHWSGPALDTVVVDWDSRHRRRLAMRGTGGTDFLLDLERAVHLRDGDGLQLEEGGIVRVAAAEEELLEISSDSPKLLLRVAWHLGNRHLAAEVAADAIRVRPDHVIEAMVRGLGADTRHVHAPFQPEGGAYGGHSHAHDHGHGHGHGH